MGLAAHPKLKSFSKMNFDHDPALSTVELGCDETRHRGREGYSVEINRECDEHKQISELSNAVPHAECFRGGGLHFGADIHRVFDPVQLLHFWKKHEAAKQGRGE